MSDGATCGQVHAAKAFVCAPAFRRNFAPIGAVGRSSKLAAGGWVELEKLLAAAHDNEFSFDLAELKTVVEQNDKRRFSFDSTGKLIRANQGHSVAVDLELQPCLPPDTLYHGTYEKALNSILM